MANTADRSTVSACAGCGAKNRVHLERVEEARCGRCGASLRKEEAVRASASGGSRRVSGSGGVSRPVVGKYSTALWTLPKRLRSAKWRPVHAAYLCAALVVLTYAGRVALRSPVLRSAWTETVAPSLKEFYWRVKDPPPPMVGVGEKINGRLTGRSIFTAENAWNQRVDTLPVAPFSGKIIARTGARVPLKADFGASYHGRPHGIPYCVVGGGTPLVPIRYEAYPKESDPGPFPIPPEAPIEGSHRGGPGDRHLLVVDRDAWKLYELFRAFPEGRGFRADSGAVWDLKVDAQRPEGWTSADAAGLPILPGLVRYDEVVEQGEIRHALRFTVERTRAAHVPPARHHASRLHQADLPPMGMRVRLRADYDVSGFPPHARVILKAMKEYGMILADNGGNWFISGTADPRWDDNQLRSLGRLRGSDLEVVEMAGPEDASRSKAPAGRVAPDNKLRIELPAETLPTDLPRTELPPPSPR